MVLVDSVVWIDHLRSKDEHLAMLLEREQIVMHPMVIGELAIGNMANRRRVLEDLGKLPEIAVATHEEVLFLIERHQLMGTGISYIDAHLLTACVLHDATKLWTRDRRLMAAADRLGVGYSADS